MVHMKPIRKSEETKIKTPIFNNFWYKAEDVE